MIIIIISSSSSSSIVLHKGSDQQEVFAYIMPLLC